MTSSLLFPHGFYLRTPFIASLLLLSAFSLHQQFCFVFFFSLCTHPQLTSHSVSQYIKSLRESIWCKIRSSAARWDSNAYISCTHSLIPFTHALNSDVLGLQVFYYSRLQGHSEEDKIFRYPWLLNPSWEDGEKIDKEYILIGPQSLICDSEIHKAL